MKEYIVLIGKRLFATYAGDVMEAEQKVFDSYPEFLDTEVIHTYEFGGFRDDIDEMVRVF